MNTAWTKWRISTAVEKGKPLSPALAQKVRRDPECRRFYQASLVMAKRLRLDAREIAGAEARHLGKMCPAESLEVGPIDSRPGVRRLSRAAGMTAAAAVIGLALGAGVWWWSAPSSPQPQPLVAVQEAEVIELLHMCRQIKDNVGRAVERKAPRWQKIIARSPETLRAPLMREAENMATDTRNILQAFSSMTILGGDGDSEPSDSQDDAPSPSS